MEAAEAQPASGLRRRHRPCRLQEGNRGGVALPKATQAMSPSGQSGVPETLLLGTSPKRGKHYTRGKGSMLIILESY
ncbi:hypothetical protein Taro_008163 [Colocasia esculenta]|uniref:Uncharacterized protein n=1 Tax=Colocasia esculenta TaxID=4460 RepID=A0A843U2C6_COLES|nr:hypothetical protein [Colocasia esculenta]